MFWGERIVIGTALSQIYKMRSLEYCTFFFYWFDKKKKNLAFNFTWYTKIKQFLIIILRKLRATKGKVLFLEKKQTR